MMNPELCQLLDDFLARDLSGEERARFEAHLPECPACQTKMQEERNLDGLLARAVTQLDCLPQRVTDAVRTRLHRRRRRRLAAGVAVLAACVLVSVLVGRWILRHEVPAPITHVDRPARPALVESPPQAVQVRVRFPKAAGVLAIPVPSESPNVTVVQVYPGLRGVRKRKHEESRPANQQRSKI